MKTLIWILSALVWGAAPDYPGDSPEFRKQREALVFQEVRFGGITDARVLSVMAEVPRHLFIPSNLWNRAYADRPLPIGEGQTISQPYIVALMTESLKLAGTERVLEIGTGSGYQAAILSRMAAEVYSIEIKEKLHERSSAVLKELGFSNVVNRHGDGYFGWEEKAPFDCIMITAAVDHIPQPLKNQLKDGGRLILPLGNPFSYQNLVLVTRSKDRFTVKQITGVLFVPMTGRALEGGREAGGGRP